MRLATATFLLLGTVIASKADASSFMQFTVHGHGLESAGSVLTDPVFVPGRERNFSLTFSIDLDVHTPDDSSPFYTADGSTFFFFNAPYTFAAAVNAGQFSASEDVEDTKLSLRNRVSFQLPSSVNSFADIRSGFASGDVQYESYRGYSYRLFSGSISSVRVAPSNGFAGFGLITVPEPTSWLMMIVGFGALGAGLRRPSARKPDLALASIFVSR